ncbi:MerR family transcriptional regulator [Nevskia ramosa]|uniref:MerR family transcriptional regulator n=1 Tax=Nevskia ramosa TaxID=64002 RepID=UPI0003B62793|nr:MerR family transcriptional regulator [Nevskia ramosa]
MSSPITPPADHRWLGPGELAREAKTSIKALRVYEKAGLLTPDRREGGWRFYGPAHVARLHQILALKTLGLSLKQIGEMLDRDGLAIGQIMDLQARHLASIIRTARNQLKRVQQARDQFATSGEVSAQLLLELARDLAPLPASDLKTLRTAIEAAACDESEQAAVRAIVNQSVADGVTEAEIGELLGEAAIAAADGDPGSDRARALADRWLVLAAALDIPGADTAEAAALRRVVIRITADPALAETLVFLRSAINLRIKSPEKG